MGVAEATKVSATPSQNTIGSANAAGSIAAIANHATYAAPAPSSSDDIVRNLIGPASAAVGQFIAEQVQIKLNQKDLDNIQKHYSSVEERGVRYKKDEMTSRQNRSLHEWAVEASSVNPDTDDRLGRAWQAVLEEIITSGDDRLLGIVKLLYPSDISELEEMIDKMQYDSEIGARFKSLGLAHNNLFTPEKISAMKFHFFAPVVVLLIATIVASILSSMPMTMFSNGQVDQFKMNLSIFGRLVVPLVLLASILVAFFSSSKVFNFRIYAAYKLTNKGREAALKIRKYKNELTAA